MPKEPEVENYVTEWCDNILKEADDLLEDYNKNLIEVKALGIALEILGFPKEKDAC